MSQTAFDSQAIHKESFANAQFELDNSIYYQAQLIAPDFTDIKIKAAITKTEIDSIADIFGALYRVWDGMKLLGTFYENLDGKWIAMPCNRDDFRPALNTSDQAHLAVVASYLQV
ncbi:MAG: hypothetical protein KME60_13550 [Cyanomargarita calcarea GSE-NOS-MK-12-04C]|jgi:hypothetical protein|uniref:Uncharacterized protein n=1 Tax=Cyanomargarita calcarea GSE-NOS-MK-12-04C TaxID=2839659 RepID=A0A951USZ9_9CYAN|nr:hypothetical protein [Cyanomargarita calcarea GSE-NOS-MK-12-04C]